jgi:methyl-accepting chemotaxis protein
MTPSRHGLLLTIGFAALVLVGSAVCVWAASDNQSLAAGFVVALTVAAAGVFGPAVHSLAAGLQRRLSEVQGTLQAARAELNETRAQAARRGDEAQAETAKLRGEAAAMQRDLDALRQQNRDHEKRIESMMGAISDATMGDLTRSVAVAGDDSLASLAMSVNEMIGGLAKMVGQLRGAAEQLAKSTAGIQSVAAEQASGANEQAASITETTATIEELAASAKQIAESAEAVVRAADSAQQCGRVAEEATRSATTGMDNIKEASARTAQTIRGLNERSQKIGDIIGIIVDIADQTKLLSLNAAIEAARAGEAGKGFAVVATEIRNLANNVTESTKEIQELLGEIQSSSTACVSATEESARRVDEGTRLVASINDGLARIHGAIDETTQSARQIGIATRQQQSASEQVATAMREIAEVAKQAADASQQTGLAASELLQLAGNLQATVGAIKTGV